MLAEGKTSCVFQIEKQFVRNFAKRMGLKRCDPWQLAVLVSIIRPGMMDTGHDRGVPASAPTVTAPSPTPRTRWRRCSRATSASSCSKRTACGWPACCPASPWPRLTTCAAPSARRSPRTWPASSRVRQGRDQEGATAAEAEEVWELIVTFGRYGFNNAHAAAYGMVISYWTAFLKRHHPLPFMMNMINSEAGSHVEGGRLQLQGVRVHRRGPQHGHQGAPAVREAVAVRLLHRPRPTTRSASA
jgi:hypothetical protein